MQTRNILPQKINLVEAKGIHKTKQLLSIELSDTLNHKIKYKDKYFTFESVKNIAEIMSDKLMTELSWYLYKIEDNVHFFRDVANDLSKGFYDCYQIPSQEQLLPLIFKNGNVLEKNKLPDYSKSLRSDEGTLVFKSHGLNLEAVDELQVYFDETIQTIKMNQRFGSAHLSNPKASVYTSKKELWTKIGRVEDGAYGWHKIPVRKK